VQACPPSAWYRFRKFTSRNRRGLATTAALLVAGLIIAGVLLSVQLQNVNRVRQISQDVRQSLAGARTAIEARDLALAGQRISEAQGRLRADAASQPALVAEIDAIRREIVARQADAALLSQFLKGASDAQDKMSFDGNEGGKRVAEDALGLYGILTEKDWLSRLEDSYLAADQKQQVRETAYVTLVSLADYYTRWRSSEPKSVERSLDLLQRAQDFHQPTRAFYFVRAGCHRAQGDIAAAEKDEKQFKAAAAQSAWDYYLPGHSAGWWGDLDEAILSYKAALRLQPNHYNSLFFLGRRLSNGRNRRQEGIAYLTACIALRPDDVTAYRERARYRRELGEVDEAIEDCRQGIRLNSGNADVLNGLSLVLDELGKLDEAIAAYREAIRLQPDVSHAHCNLGGALAKKGAVDEATASYLKAVAIWHESPRASSYGGGELNNFAWTLACHVGSVRDPAQAAELARGAVELARRAVELDPNQRNHWGTLVAALDSARDWKAIEALGRSELFDPNKFSAFSGFLLAKAHWKLGHADEARALYDKAVALMEKNGLKDEQHLHLRFRVAALLGLSKLPADVFAPP
jgi:tetratricopeptide (TPR) repeat protein